MRGSATDKLCNMTNVAEIHTLSDNPTFSCGRCGAKAHTAESICDPVQLPEVGHFGD